MVELCRGNLFVLINYSFASIKDWKTKKKKKKLKLILNQKSKYKLNTLSLKMKCKKNFRLLANLLIH